jgi:hypothetical protein
VANRFETRGEILKVDDLGTVFGRGITWSEDRERNLDQDAEAITPGEMLTAVTNCPPLLHYRRDARRHQVDGSVARSFPLAGEIAKVYGIGCEAVLSLLLGPDERGTPAEATKCYKLRHL